jgi:predicted hotdog family 3-hydroxylacyl-ACP dehydratase
VSETFPIDELVPHSGDMSFLDAVVDSSPEFLSAIAQVHDNNPFLIDEAISAWVGVEFMAQGIAAWAGIQAKRSNEPIRAGFLVGTRKFECNRAKIVLSTKFDIYVEKIMEAANGLSGFSCTLSGEYLYAKANINVFQPQDIELFMKPGTGHFKGK